MGQKVLGKSPRDNLLGSIYSAPFITRHAVNRVKPCIYIDNLNCARNKQGIQGQSILDPSPVLDLELWILYSGLSNFEILSALIIIIIIYVLTTKMIRCEPLSHSVYF